MIKRFINYLISINSRNISIPLGRWTRNQNVPLKIDWANVDHCGTCSFTNLEPTKIIVDTKNTKLV